MKHVIIGAGAAGMTAAKTIRSIDPQAEIIVISEDKQVHSRCMLHKYIGGERDEAALNFMPENFFEANNIAWLNGTTVTSVDSSAKLVHCGQDSVTYDKLLIAGGAVSADLPVPGLDKAKNVYGLRNLSDAKNIKDAASKSQRAVIVGGGFVGLDAAYALLGLGKEVAAVEMAKHILPLNLDMRAAQAYQEKFEEAGAKLYLGRKVTAATVGSDGNVTRLLLDDGSTLPCDFVVAATGVRAAVGFLEGSGVAVDKGVLVDQYMATNCSDIYAAGDITGLSGIWPCAMSQGAAAAKNMCGIKEVYENAFSSKNTVNFFGLVTLTAGTLEPSTGDIVECYDDQRGYSKIILRDGRAIGVIMQGDIKGGGFWQYAIKHGIRIDSIKKPIWKVSFADFCAMDERGSYIYTV